MPVFLNQVLKLALEMVNSSSDNTACQISLLVIEMLKLKLLSYFSTNFGADQLFKLLNCAKLVDKWIFLWIVDFFL
jgi:hypothetical protein